MSGSWFSNRAGANAKAMERGMAMKQARAVAVAAIVAAGVAGGAGAQSPVEFEIFGTIDSVTGSLNGITTDDLFRVTGSYDADAIVAGALTPADDLSFMFMLEVLDDAPPMNTLFGPLVAGDDFLFDGGPRYTFDTNGDLEEIDFFSASLGPSVNFFAAGLNSPPTGDGQELSILDDELEILGSVTEVKVSPNGAKYF
jgi:hypothetical protein